MDTATQQRLVTLSRVDGELREFERQIAAGPGRIERLRQRSRQLEAELEAAEHELVSTGARRRDFETEAEVLKGKIAEYEQQLFALRSNSDYQAMLHQIADTKTRMNSRENEALELMEREEELGTRLDHERNRIQDQLDGNAEEITDLDRRLAALATERQTKLGERDTAVAGLTGATRRLYDRIHRGMGGVAVVSVAKGACGGCFSNLPPQRVNEARLGDRLVTCETCGRIIVWDEAESSAS